MPSIKQKKFDELNLREQIVVAMPVARALIHEGIDTYTRHADSIVDCVSSCWTIRRCLSSMRTRPKTPTKRWQTS